MARHPVGRRAAVRPGAAVSTRRLPRAVAAVLAVTVLGTGCGHAPDTTLRPAPPAFTFAPVQHPFADAKLAVDPQTQAARWQRANGDARWLDPITRGPQARWLNAPQDLDTLPSYLAEARRQRALPVVVAYAIPNRNCGNFTEGLPYADLDRPNPRPDSYHAFITRLIQVLGRRRTVVVMEPDAVAAVCFDAARAATLKDAVERLAAAGQYVYLDAGHPAWVPSGVIARRLLDSGIAAAEGVSLNVSNRYPTDAVAEFGEELSDLIGGRDYVVDSSRNGTPTPPAGLDNDWCNRPDQGLGVQRTGSADPVRYPHMAAQLWIKPPGESDGNAGLFPGVDCHGETRAPGLFSPRQARGLIMNAAGEPAAVRRVAQAATVG